jgi:hypothetical protein
MCSQQGPHRRRFTATTLYGMTYIRPIQKHAFAGTSLVQKLAFVGIRLIEKSAFVCVRFI